MMILLVAAAAAVAHEDTQHTRQDACTRERENSLEAHTVCGQHGSRIHTQQHSAHVHAHSFHTGPHAQ